MVSQAGSPLLQRRQSLTKVAAKHTRTRLLNLDRCFRQNGALRRLGQLRLRCGVRWGWGFTLVELLLVLAIIGTLTSIGMPRIQESLDRAKIARAIGDIRALQAEITCDPLPGDLAAIGRDGMLDPWGNPYVYNPHVYGKGRGEPRKDRFLVPLNSEYDLYSMGKDGQSQSPLNAAVSKDDIVRADDGGYVGLASKY